MGLITTRGIKAVVKGAGARGIKAIGLDLVGRVYMPLI
jgi:hypothetical protein